METKGAAIARRARGVYALLEQDRVWVDAEGTQIPIEEMSITYVENVIGFLERRVEHLAFQHGLGAAEVFGNYEDAHGFADRALDELWDRQSEDPEGWLDSTPLMRKLRSRVENAGFAP